MTAEVLRRAAALMRERAEAVAAQAPWTPVVRDMWDGRTSGRIAVAGDEKRHGRARRWLFTESIAGGDVHHIASWHPAVALAVADLLSDLAIDYEDGAIDGTTHDSALAVARAYLGEQA